MKIYDKKNKEILLFSLTLAISKYDNYIKSFNCLNGFVDFPDEQKYRQQGTVLSLGRPAGRLKQWLPTSPYCTVCVVLHTVKSARPCEASVTSSPVQDTHIGNQ